MRIGMHASSGVRKYSYSWILHVRYSQTHLCLLKVAFRLKNDCRVSLNGKDFKGFFSWATHKEAEHPQSSTHARKFFLDFDQ
jgi:hypothetical protein